MTEVEMQKYNRIFWEFVHKYDTNNQNILRKVIHSFSVAEKCFDIACRQKYNKKQRELCYLLGLLHDVGRFEQWKVYQTYNDHHSTNHGVLGAEILNKMGHQTFDLSQKEYYPIVEAIRYHTGKYNGDDKQIKTYHEIIQNADALANTVACADGLHQIRLEADGYSQEIMDNFLQLKPLFMFSPNTKLDRILMLTANCYYVRLKYLRQDILRKGYIDAIYDVFSAQMNDEQNKIYKSAVATLKKNLKNDRGTSL